MLSQLSDWIVTTPFSIYLQNLKGMVPVVQTAHIVAIAVVLSSAAMIDLRLLGLISKDRPLGSIGRRFQPGIWIGLVVLAPTGLLLLIAEPARSLLSFQFQLKMVLLAAGVVITLVLQRAIRTNASRWDDGAVLPTWPRILAVASLAIWAAIIMAGRWIAYA